MIKNACGYFFLLLMIIIRFLCPFFKILLWVFRLIVIVLFSSRLWISWASWIKLMNVLKDTIVAYFSDFWFKLGWIFKFNYFSVFILILINLSGLLLYVFRPNRHLAVLFSLGWNLSWEFKILFALILLNVIPYLKLVNLFAWIAALKLKIRNRFLNLASHLYYAWYVLSV